MIVDSVQFRPPISYLEAGPLFWPFAVFFVASVLLALGNIWKARGRCLTEGTRKRMTYLLVGIAAPGIGAFPYLIGAGRLNEASNIGTLVLFVALLVNTIVAVMLPVMSYSVAYFGVLTPDRVVRYRMLRFFIRAPVVAILVILAILTDSQGGNAAGTAARCRALQRDRHDHRAQPARVERNEIGR